MQKKIITILSSLLCICIVVIAYLLIINMPMMEDTGAEIERKWLINIDDVPYDLSKAASLKIVQTYLNFSPEIRVRNINDGERYILTVKSDMSVDGLTRDEKEYYINEEEYNHLLTKQEGNAIIKTRYQIFEKGIIIEIDKFENELEGLAYMEIEFDDEEKARAFETPDWVIKDVTSDIRYKNGHLARFGIPE
ncbi:MAG: adenylate cyclase [Clostridia bacterium]|nr:adenylate cyclase [Clostridia bacterium]